MSRTPPGSQDPQTPAADDRGHGDVDMPEVSESQGTNPTPLPPSTPVVSHYRPQFPDGLDEELAYEDFEKYFIRSPDADTVLEHRKFQLWKFDLVINKRRHALICGRCKVTLHPNTAHDHVSVHYGVLGLPDEMIKLLVKEFSLLPPDQLERPTDIPAPLYGLELPHHDFHFCGRCGRGYALEETLRVHHATPSRCTVEKPLNREDHVGPGQRFTNHAHNSYFAVDLTKLPVRRPIDDVTPLQAVRANPLPRFNYSAVPFATPKDEMSLSIFAKSQQWTKFLAGNEPELVFDSCRSATKDDGDLYELQSTCVDYFRRMQPEIESYLHFGVQRLLAQIGPYVLLHCPPVQH